MENQYMPAQETQGNLRDFLTVLFKHKSRIITIFLSTVTTVTVGTFLLSPVYEAKSSLLVKIGRENIYRPEVGDRSPVVSINPEEVVNTEINILTSRDLIEKMITTLKIENIYPDLIDPVLSHTTSLDAAIMKFSKNLSAEGLKKSNVIEVTFKHKDPRIAARAVNLLVEYYRVKHLQVYSGTESSFLDKQLATYDQKLKQSANNLEGFKQKNQVYSLDEQRSLLLKQRTELDTTLKNSINTVDELQKRLASLKGLKQGVAADSSLYTMSELDKIIVDARSRLLSLQLEEQDLLKKYKEENRLVQHVRNEIRMVKGFLADQEQTIGGKVKTGNLVYQEVQKELVKTEADLNAQRAKADTLKQQVGQLDGELRSLELRDKELQGLKRDYSITEKNYQTYTEKTEEARISDDMNRNKLANVSVIQAATAPAKPIKPKKLLNIVLGIVLGAVSGLGFAFFSEYTSQVFSTPESAERRLGLPVLVTIARKG
jgi:polysaccharide biosynthesis protein PslE